MDNTLEAAYENVLQRAAAKAFPNMAGPIGTQQVQNQKQYAAASRASGQKSPEQSNGEDVRPKIVIRDVTLDKAKNIVLPLLKTKIVPFLWGPPGVGKSSLVRDICEEKGWDLIDLRLSLLNPVDLRGLPVVNREEKLAEWYHPSFLPNGHHKKPGILFLDEINLAPLSVQAAAYQLILDKRVGEYRFPDHWKIIAAGNRETDRANVYKISAPLANRFVHLTITPDLQSWRDWAVSKGKIRTEIIDFLITRPALLLTLPKDGDKAFPSPRTWSFVSEFLDAFDFTEEAGPSEDLQQVIVGAIGKAAGEEFLGHLSDYNLKEISKQIDAFVKTGKITLPEKPESTRFAIITAILDAHLGARVSGAHFEAFLKQLSGEERETVKSETEMRREITTPPNFDAVDDNW